MTDRTPLPQRRPNETIETKWQDHPFTVTIGYDDSGVPMEVFANHAKGAMAAMLADACVLISIGLQHGISPMALSKSLGTVPEVGWGEEVIAPASPIGALMAVLVTTSS